MNSSELNVTEFQLYIDKISFDIVEEKNKAQELKNSLDSIGSVYNTSNLKNLNDLESKISLKIEKFETLNDRCLDIMNKTKIQYAETSSYVKNISEGIE